MYENFINNVRKYWEFADGDVLQMNGGLNKEFWRMRFWLRPAGFWCYWLRSYFVTSALEFKNDLYFSVTVTILWKNQINWTLHVSVLFCSCLNSYFQLMVVSALSHQKDLLTGSRSLLSRRLNNGHHRCTYFYFLFFTLTKDAFNSSNSKFIKQVAHSKINHVNKDV